MPPLLLGLPGDNTYSNYSQANRTFWRQTVIPLATRVAKALSAWLGQGLELRGDLDALTLGQPSGVLSTEGAGERAKPISSCRSIRALGQLPWVPAFAGMTAPGGMEHFPLVFSDF